MRYQAGPAPDLRGPSRTTLPMDSLRAPLQPSVHEQSPALFCQHPGSHASHDRPSPSMSGDLQRDLACDVLGKSGGLRWAVSHRRASDGVVSSKAHFGLQRKLCLSGPSASKSCAALPAHSRIGNVARPLQRDRSFSPSFGATGERCMQLATLRAGCTARRSKCPTRVGVQRALGESAQVASCVAKGPHLFSAAYHDPGVVGQPSLRAVVASHFPPCLCPACRTGAPLGP